MEASREKEHLLALKVMRLTKPSLMPFHPLICDKRDLSGGIYQQMDADDLSKPSGVDYFGVGDLLTLPQNFGNILCPALTCEDNKEFCQLSKWNESLDKGKTAKIKQYLNLRNIFLGETFSSYISVHNDSLQLCRDIAVKADLQTSSQRLMLSGVTPHPTAQLTPDDSIDGVIHHEVKELGTHILVCAVSYVSESGEKMAFRKFFKFQVLKPLDVKTKFYNAESDEVYLEAQIQNITPGPIFMDHVSLEPSISYTVKKMNDTPDTEGSHPVFGKVNYLNSLDTRQYLYCLTPKPEAYAESKVLKGVTNIGKLDITWRTNMGERGRLQTSQLQRVAPGYGDIRLTVESIPDTVTLETTFTITFRITNCCERVVDLTLILQNNISAGVLWCGLSGKQLGKLPQNNSMDLPLTVIATSPGLQTVSGLRLTDNFLKRTYEHDEIAQVFVCG